MVMELYIIGLVTVFCVGLVKIEFSSEECNVFADMASFCNCGYAYYML